MSVIIQGDQVRAIALGIAVEKAGVSPVSGTSPLFTVAGGKVLIVGVVGEVTTAMDGTTTSINLNHDPTVGSAVNICAATVVTSDVVGTVYGYSGVITELLTSSGTAAPGTAYTRLPSTGMVLTPGVIGQVGTAADAGVVTWTCIYVPVDDGASVAAA
ncbi:MAG: hypothetical protein L0H84_00855 [Pseudonocardia sp.]|nr:hypothetical protein [Pseudonocardia sp.]